jgi:hypothetical protein
MFERILVSRNLQIGVAGISRGRTLGNEGLEPGWDHNSFTSSHGNMLD